MIGFAGMTHMGWVQAATAAERGHKVVSLEENPDEFAKCELAFITLDVPTEPDGTGHFEPVEALTREVLEMTTGTVVLMSQVPPGFTRKFNEPRLYYQVETLIYGRSFERAMQPERFIVGIWNYKGVPDEKVDFATNYLNYLQSFRCPLFVMSYESAELSKLAISRFLVAQVSTSVELDAVASRVGAKWEDVCKALKSDKRIGEHAYLRPGKWDDSIHLKRDVMTLRTL